MEDKKEKIPDNNQIIQERINNFLIKSFLENLTTKSTGEKIRDCQESINTKQIKEYTLSNLSYKKNYKDQNSEIEKDL